ncbi:MAG: hypothetical protein Q7T74_00700 [Candidatus Saccharibacteria bacterium]|nr:hypothetical protein [Candidatus Saccharibacteria bacterium]
MALKKVKAFVLLTLLSAACSLNAQILNGSFDANSTLPASWQIDHNGVLPEIRQSFSTAEQPYSSSKYPPIIIQPVGDSQYFALLRSDSRDHVATRRDSFGRIVDFCQISQTITVRAGQYITGEYFFSTGDYLPYNDMAIIKLVPDPCSDPADFNEILLAQKNVADVGDFQTMAGWETFIYDFNEAKAGTYTLILQVEDVGDDKWTSRLAVDALKIECSYELAGDINSDCVVDFYDFAILANQWLNECIAPTWCNNADINPLPEGNKVNFSDVMILAEHWLIDCGVIPLDTACESQ